MVTEQDKTLEALQIAIQMEIDGKEYYLKASQESSNELSKKLLQKNLMISFALTQWLPVESN